MKKRNLRRIAAGFILFAFSIGMFASFAGLFGTTSTTADGDDLAVEDSEPDQVVDHRIDLPCYATPEDNQVRDYRMDTPADLSGHMGGGSQVVDFRIDYPW